MKGTVMAANSDSAPVANPLAPGDIQFLDNFIPTLDPGQYTIEVKQTLGIAAPPAGAPAPPSPPVDFPPPLPIQVSTQMTVGGAGLALSAADVYSVYPPAHTVADYTKVLPHVVLNPRTLPWEVQLAVSPPATPWMALVVLAESEIGQTQTITLGMAQQAAPGLLTPQVPASEAANTTTPVTVVDISTDTFSALMPQIAEVPYLAHCRQVNATSKEDELTSGWFSVVVANRFPSVFSSQADTRFTAHLISLYGLDGYLNSPTPSWPVGTTTVRLLSLTNWSFTCSPAESLDFRTLMANLAVPPAGTASGDSTFLLLKLPTAAAASRKSNVNFSDPIHEAVAEAFAAGYVLTPYATRQGDDVTAWYRGPLCPVPTPRLPLNPIILAGQAMIYDQVAGMFDQSYAVAWETGRMLALSDRNFVTKVAAWRGKGQQLLNQLYFNIQQNPALSSSIEQLAAGNPDVRRLRSLLEPDLLGTTTFLPYIANAFAQSAAIDLQAIPDRPPASVPLPAAAGPPSPGAPPRIITALTTLAAQAWVQSALLPLLQDQTDSIAEWLGQMCLLNGVPFANLVPDPRLLPPESIRFFYVDQTYLDAMTDGALSVGVRSSRDTQFNDIMHTVLHDAVDSEMAAVRAKHLGIAPSAQTDTGPISGFLLRSAVVSGFPGLEVRALLQDGKTTMPALRIDRLAPDVLFALFPGVPGQISLSEPQEGLRFGVEDNDILQLRNVGDSDPGTQLTTTTAQYRAGAGRVFDVAGTLQQIAKVAPTLANIGPAGFAVQMINSPEQMCFYGASA